MISSAVVMVPVAATCELCWLIPVCFDQPGGAAYVTILMFYQRSEGMTWVQPLLGCYSDSPATSDISLFSIHVCHSAVFIVSDSFLSQRSKQKKQ